MTQNSFNNCVRIYLEAFILPKKELTINDMVFAELWLYRGKGTDEAIRELFTEEELAR